MERKENYRQSLSGRVGWHSCELGEIIVGHGKMALPGVAP